MVDANFDEMPDSLLQFESPVPLMDDGSPSINDMRSREMKVGSSQTDEILNSILPPRYFHATFPSLF